MSIALIASVASMAMELGPTVIRGVSSLFGGSETADKVADIVEQADGLFGADKAQKELAVSKELQKLPPESLVELERIKLELEKEQTRRRELAYQDKQAEHHETQTTIRAGDKAEDEYVRHTRPWGCRLSLYSAIVYVFVFEALEAFGKGDGASWEFATMLIAPFMTYLGWRTADKRGYTKALKQGLNAINPLALVKQGGR